MVGGGLPRMYTTPMAERPSTMSLCCVGVSCACTFAPTATNELPLAATDTPKLRSPVTGVPADGKRISVSVQVDADGHEKV